MHTHSSEHPGTAWYAIHVRSKSESMVSTVLRGKGYEEFLPLYRARRHWSDRVKELDLPLFTGYLFCRFDVRDRLLPILTTPGVLSILGSGKVPIPVDEEEIQAVRTVLRSGLLAQPWPYLQVGDKVYVEHGPLTGIEGTVDKLNNKKCQLVVSVTLLQKSLAVAIDRDWARPVLKGTGPRSVPLTQRLQRSIG